MHLLYSCMFSSGSRVRFIIMKVQVTLKSQLSTFPQKQQMWKKDSFKRIILYSFHENMHIFIFSRSITICTFYIQKFLIRSDRFTTNNILIIFFFLLCSYFINYALNSCSNKGVYSYGTEIILKFNCTCVPSSHITCTIYFSLYIWH